MVSPLRPTVRSTVEISAMLYDIQTPATAENSVILLKPRDNVAVARVRIDSGQQIEAGGVTVLAHAAIPAGHKIALHAVSAGEPVYRYGNIIGFATRLIEPGDHVHVHNLGFEELQTTDAAPISEPAPPPPFAESATFLGYARPDGRVGTRNYIAIVAASNCAASTAELIAGSFAGESLPANLNGVVAFPHGEGCAQAI